MIVETIKTPRKSDYIMSDTTCYFCNKAHRALLSISRGYTKILVCKTCLGDFINMLDMCILNDECVKEIYLGDL